MVNIISKPRPKLKSGVDEDGTRFFYDITTKNISFLQTSADLKKLGIQNNQFFLKLYDRELIGVDPFSPSLSNELIERINFECAMNPWFFRRECVRIPTEAGGTGPGSGVLFMLHRANLALSWCFDNCVSFYEVIPRQTGKTQSTLANYNYAFLYGTTNSQFNFCCKTQGDSDANLEKLRVQKERLPIYMQQRFQFVFDERSQEMKVVAGKDNVRTLSNPITHNVIVSKPSATTIAKADGIGRGNSAPLQYYDEAEFTPFIGTILKASGPAFGEAAAHAEKNGGMYGRVITSTPGFIGTEPVIAMNEWRERMGIFTEKMYDMPSHGPGSWREYIKKNSQNGFMYIEFSYKQIGRDENWYQKMCAYLNHDVVQIKRELLLQRIANNTNSPFAPEDLETINSFRGHPIEEHIVHQDFLLRVYRPIDKTIPYVIGVDVSTGLNEDYTVATFIDPYTEVPVAVFRTPLLDEVEAAECLAELIAKFAPKGLLAIERNNIGSSVISILRKSKWRKFIYNDPTKMDNTPDDKLDRKGQLIKQAENRRYWGICTTGKSRDRMMAILLNRAIHEKDKFVCNEIIDEMNTLVKNSRGTIAAAAGYHDDCVMSYLIGMYVIKHGINLRRYGIIQGLKYDEEDQKPFQEEPEDDPVKMWERLPEAYKKIFPKPNQTLVHGVSATAGAFVEKEEDIRPKEPDPLYNQIQGIQKRRALRKAIIDNEDLDNIDINKIESDNDYIREMVSMAENRTRRAGVGDYGLGFDIADLLNK